MFNFPPFVCQALTSTIFSSQTQEPIAENIKSNIVCIFIIVQQNIGTYAIFANDYFTPLSFFHAFILPA